MGYAANTLVLLLVCYLRYEKTLGIVNAFTLCGPTRYHITFVHQRRAVVDASQLSRSCLRPEKMKFNGNYQHSQIFRIRHQPASYSQLVSATSAIRVDKDVGGYDPSERLGGREINVGDPQLKLQEKEFSVSSILKELAAIQQQGPQKYCLLGTRHCSFLHQQIIELLAYALVLSGNHVYTSGAGGTHAATIRGALRAERPELLTVVLPQSMSKQAQESQKLLKDVKDIITMPQNDALSLDIASRICNSYLLSQTDQLISFAFHESTTVIEATKEAKKLDMLVTVLYLD